LSAAYFEKSTVEPAMTLTSTTNRVQYDGDDSTVEFPVTFVYWANANIAVVHTDADGTETPWVLGTQYTLSGGSGETGTLTVDTAPTDYTPATGETLTIYSNLLDKQETALPAGGPFPSAATEQQLDKLVRLIQQKAEALGRAIKLKVSSAFSELTLPDPEADKVIGWNAGGTDLENKTPNTDAYVTLPLSVANGGIGDLAKTDGNFIVGNGTTWVAESGATARTSLGVAIGSDVQAYDADAAKTDVAQAFTAPQRADQETVTDGTLDLSEAQNFHYTPSGADGLDFANEAAGQSGMIYLVNGSNYAITLGAEITGPTGMATAISATGNYLISYWVHTAGGGADTVACSYVKVV
jgi:hypothetical protein